MCSNLLRLKVTKHNYLLPTSATKVCRVGSAAAAPFITCSAASEWKDHFPPAFKRSIVREFSSQATDELGAPQGPSIHLALSCFVQQTLNRWAFVLTPSHLLTRPAPDELPPLRWQCAPENWYSHICVTSVLCLDLCQFYTRYRQSGEKHPDKSSSTGVYSLITFLWAV